MEKIWFVTGSTRGLGSALAAGILAAGHKLVATARNPAQLASLQAAYGDRVLPVRLDVTRPEEVYAAVEAAIAKFGRIDVLVNNAGYGDIGSIEDTSLEDFRAQIETNLFGVIATTKAVIPHMRAQRAGHIVQFSSVGGRLGAMGRAPYSAAKWGVEGFSEVLAKEMAPLGVKVTIVEPGGFRTDFAGSSTTIRPVRPEYESTVGRAARFQLDYNGKQPGDPAKAASLIIRVTELDEPPLRLLLGSDAFRVVTESDRLKAEADLKWRVLSVSTDF